MEITEKVILIVSIFGGFLWLRARARFVNSERQAGRVLVGIFLVLPALLVMESKAFERFHFGQLTDMLVKTLVICTTIAAVGFGFLRKPAPEAAKAEADADMDGNSPTPPGR